MKSTKKKKNTYVVNLDTTLCPLELFCLCENTPMAVVTLNGEKLQENTNWNGSMLFPNPPATTMVNMYKQLKPIMGKKLASTIIEYHDKETKEPITFLFPTNEISTSYKSLEELKQRLNHATRQDLERQANIREKYLNMLSMKNEEKTR